MVRIETTFLTVTYFLALVKSHFVLEWPPTLGLSESDEGIAPCDGFDRLHVSTFADFYVGGDSVAVTSTHPESTWLFRVTLNETVADGWTNLAPAIRQNGLGEFCKPDVKVPSIYIGNEGIIQIVEASTDGLSYQCARVTFVRGALYPKRVPMCKNVTGVIATYTTSTVFSNVTGFSFQTPTYSSPSGLATSITTHKNDKNALSSGDKAGIAIGAIFTAFCPLLVFVIMRRRKRRQAKLVSTTAPPSYPYETEDLELDGNFRNRPDTVPPPYKA